MINVIQKIFGSANDRYLRRIKPDVVHIASFEDKLKKLSDEELREQTAKFKRKLDSGATLEDIKHEAFATVREVSRRVMNMRHYDVQMIGGMVLHEGKIAEMRTGEGKTLVATSPLYLNALAGKGAHLVTVNDYLARRDAELMGRIYGFLGLSTGVIVSNISDEERRRAYASDITYGTNNEFGFDYLRDNMKYSLKDLVQRGLHFAIVDEVDSILIDEARTPLIISGQADRSTDMYRVVNDVIPYLRKDEDYLVDEEARSVSLTDAGVEVLERRLRVKNLYDPTNVAMVHHVNKALQAHTLYKKDVNYMVKDGEVIIVDEFTGRAMEGRRWSDGLHQAIEAKEGVEIQPESQTMATVTFQNFFRMYKKLAGMTGTAETEAEEFHTIYKLETVVIPTNKPICRKDEDDVVYRSYREKFNAIIEQIEDCYTRQQPVLVGTTSVEKSEAISVMLKKKGIRHEVLNAKYHEREAHIVAQAGRLGAVTIATNMAGRGTDILLGGNPEALATGEIGAPTLPPGVPQYEIEKYYTPEYRAALAKYKEQCSAEREEVLKRGGLFIIGTERHESRRIDNQLRGRAGRQGDPGHSRFFLSLEDDLLRLFGADRIAKFMDTLKMEEGVPIEHPMVTRSIESAQRKVEGRNFDIRRNLLEYDDVMDKQRKTIYAMRFNVLRGKDEQGHSLTEMLTDVMEEVLIKMLDEHASRLKRPEEWDLEGLQTAVKQIYNVEVALSASDGRDSIERAIWKAIVENLKDKRRRLRPLAKQLEEQRLSRNKMIAEIGVSLGRFGGDEDEDKPITADTLFEQQIQNQFLRSIDRFWREHLQAMEQMRDGIGMRGYAQKDPKQEYKKEGFNLFTDMMLQIKTNVSEFMSKFEPSSPQSLDPGIDLRPPQQLVYNRQDAEAELAEKQAEQARREREAQRAAQAAPVVVELPKVGRNDPCPCGSGKKYKNCHMLIDNPRRRSSGDKASDEVAASDKA
jgi:preprotein translocase subunit SecA